MKKDLDKYIKSGHKDVEGWLTRTAMTVLVELANVQREFGLKGPVCEIGVHHGKLFILLHMLTENNEVSVAWDLFEDQDENVDCSGYGNREVLIRNLKYHKCDLSRIKIFTKNSLALTCGDIIRDCNGKVRIFSVDGGHEAENTYNDLRLAEESLCDGGIVVLDDFFNESWPGVSEGTCKYFLSNNSNLAPLVISGNKIFFSNSAERALSYVAGLDCLRFSMIRKITTMFGNKVLVLIPPARNNFFNYMRNSPLWNSVRKKKVVEALFSVVRQ